MTARNLLFNSIPQIYFLIKYLPAKLCGCKFLLCLYELRKVEIEAIMKTFIAMNFESRVA
jgi:hypothetical protein